jgi:hypothetical protein
MYIYIFIYFLILRGVRLPHGDAAANGLLHQAADERMVHSWNGIGKGKPKYSESK